MNGIESNIMQSKPRIYFFERPKMYNRSYVDVSLTQQTLR